MSVVTSIRDYFEARDLEAKLRKMDNDPRWFRVKDWTPVVFEGNLTTWGELGTTERKCCRFDNQGQLIGEYE